jgi:UDP-glucuronate 4-epimerase
MSNPILVTGSAGFIGFHLCQRLLSDGFNVIGLDAMTDYYDVSLKEKRLELLKAHDAFTPITARLEAPDVLENLFATYKPSKVIHLAAQAGVRYSIDEPRSYVQSNICGSIY